MLSINFPEKFTPSLTDNFVSNKVVFKDLDFDKIPDGLLDISKWETYYENSSDVHMYNQDSTVLKNDTRFRFKTPGFDVEARIGEYDPGAENGVLCLAWYGWNEAKGDEFLDVYHAWLVQRLDRNRIRILTQGFQISTPVRELTKSVPSTMMLDHQVWLDGPAVLTKYQKK